jgi:hypothetical protein
MIPQGLEHEGVFSVVIYIYIKLCKYKIVHLLVIYYKLYVISVMWQHVSTSEIYLEASGMKYIKFYAAGLKMTL